MRRNESTSLTYLALQIETIQFVRFKNVFFGLKISDGVEEDVETTGQKTAVGRRPAHGVRLAAARDAVSEQQPVTTTQ